MRDIIIFTDQPIRFEDCRAEISNNIKDVETNGNISVLQKPENRTPTAEDMNINIQDTGIETVVISDGEYLKKSMELCCVSKKKIEKILKDNNTSKEEVFIMTYNKIGDYNIIRTDNN